MIAKPKNITKEKIFQALVSSLLLIFTFFVIGPLGLYVNNISEFWFTIKPLLFMVLVSGFVLWATITLVLCVLPSKVSTLLSAIIFGLGVATYIQGTYMQMDYGLLDGSPVDWSRFGIWGLLNSAIWVLCIFLPMVYCVVKKSFPIKVVKILTILILTVQTVTVSAALFDVDLFKTKLSVSENGMFELSKNKNVIVFLLDTFDRELMKKLITMQPEYKKEFENFTFYENTLGMYPTTACAVPYLLTGAQYKNEVTYKDYLKTAFEKSQLFSTLKSYNYDCSVYSLQIFASSSWKGIISNVIEEKPQISSYLKLSKMIYKLTAMQYFPHALKKNIWMFMPNFDIFKKNVNETFDVADSIGFYQKLTNNKITTTNEKNVFQFYHLKGAHQPFNYNENLEPIAENFGNETDVTKASFKIIDEYMRQLKDKGMYDNTMIVITSDHGGTEYGLHEYPTLMIKNFGENHAFSTSEAPISHSDMVPDILNKVTNTNNFGKSIEDWKENDLRSRPFLYYRWKDNWNASYMPEMVEYNFISDSKDHHLVIPQKTLNIFTSNGIKKSDITMKLNQEYSFSDPAQAGTFFVTGLSDPEGDFAWSNEKNVYLQFTLKNPSTKNIKLDFQFAHVAGNYQTIETYSGDNLISKNVIRNNNMTTSLIIPNGSIQNNHISLKLFFSNAIRPQGGKDTREMAVAFKSMKLTETSEDKVDSINEIELDKEYSFSNSGDGICFFSYGVFAPDGDFAWSDGKEASLEFILKEKVSKDLRLDFQFAQLLNDSQSISIYVGDRLISKNIVENRIMSTSFIIPKEVIKENKLSVRLCFDNAAVPEGGKDPRTLAVGFKSIKIAQLSQ